MKAKLLRVSVFVLCFVCEICEVCTMRLAFCPVSGNTLSCSISPYILQVSNACYLPELFFELKILKLLK